MTVPLLPACLVWIHLVAIHLPRERFILSRYGRNEIPYERRTTHEDGNESGNS